MIKIFSASILFFIFSSVFVSAGLPPTTSKLSTDSANKTTFNYQFPNFTGSHNGTTVALSVNSIGGGGTGQSTKAAAFDALSPMTTSGDIIYGGASGTGTRLAKGSDTNVLTLASGIPSWAAPSAGANTVESLSAGKMRYVSAKQAAPSGGSCGTTSETGGDWLNGNCTSGATGVCTCTINGGVFSATPVCGCNVDRATPGARICNTASSSSTAVVFADADSSTGGGANADRNIWCYGPQ